HVIRQPLFDECAEAGGASWWNDPWHIGSRLRHFGTRGRGRRLRVDDGLSRRLTSRREQEHQEWDQSQHRESPQPRGSATRWLLIDASNRGRPPRLDDLTRTCTFIGPHLSRARFAKNASESRRGVLEELTLVTEKTHQA